MELKKQFASGKMNKDLDPRFVPDGEYIDALNVIVSNTEGQGVGSAQNVYGLEFVSNYVLPEDALCIGSVADEANSCVYWLVQSSSVNLVLEYNEITGNTTVVLQDDRDGDENVLNFNPQYQVTGINVIYNSFNKQKLLVWTDDLNPIRCVNVSRAKGYGLNGFSNDDISLYKKPPFEAPNCTPTIVGDGSENNIRERFLSFAYRYKYLDGEYSALSSFSNPQFYPSGFRLDFVTQENSGMVNQFNGVRIEFNTGDRNVSDVQLVFKESNSDFVYIIDTFNKEKKFWSDNTAKDFVFSNNKIYSILPEDEIKRLFDNVPLKAKAQEFIGNRLIYGNYVEGRDLVDVDGNEVKADFVVGYKSEDFSDSELTTSFEDISVVNDVVEINFAGTELKKDSVINISFRAISDVDSYSGIFFGGSVYNCNLSYYLTKDYANAGQLVLDPDFVNFISVVASSNFENQSTIVAVDNEDNSYPDKFQPFQIISSSNVNVLKIKLPFVKHRVWTNYPTTPEIYDEDNFAEYMKFVESSMIVFLSQGNSLASCKSNRSYEAGIVYLDDSGRYSTVIANESDSDGTVFIPVSESYKKNSLNIEINHKAPKWANRYKIFIKDNKLEYQTIYGSFVFKDGNFAWIKLEGLDNQKVAVGDNLILKRDINGPRDFLTKVEVLDYKTQLSDFIESSDFSEPAGNYIRIKNTASIDFANAEAIFKEVEANSSARKGSATARASLFTEFDGTSYTDYEIKVGSKIKLFIRNEKGGGSGGRYVYEKEFIALNTYPSFYEFYQSEVINATPFNVEFFRVEDGLDQALPQNQQPVNGTGYLYCGVQSIMNGNAQNRTFMYLKFSILSSDNLLIFETDPKDKSSQIFFETQDTYFVDENGNHLGRTIDDSSQNYNASIPAFLRLNFFNCYSQGNGAESYIVKDKFNGNYLSTATRGNAVEIDGYNETRNIASLTYSGAFDETTNYNSLNEFNLSRANYKDLDDRYGSIQKLFTKDTNLLVFQQYKVHNILYTKNILFDSVGGGQVASIENVLGNEVPYAGEFGIGNHPESFAFYGNSMYFTDNNKRCVLRLGGDGLQPISMSGMISEFVKLFEQYKNNFIYGGFDDKKQQYYLTFSDFTKVVEQEENPCNTFTAGVVTSNSGYDFNISVPKQNFEMDIPYNFSGEVDVVIRSGENVDYFSRLSGSGVINYNKITNEDSINVSIATEEDSVTYDITPLCPELGQGEVVLMVVNDEEDQSKSMKTAFTWIEPVSGLNGGISNNDVFSPSGVARFELLSGDEGSGPIPISGSTINVTAKDGSFDFKPCNRIGYLVSQLDLNINQVLDDASWLELDFAGTKATGSFLFTKPSEDHKLYIIWDCASKVSLVDDNVSLNSGESITIPVLNNDEFDGDVSVSILSGPYHGTAEVVSNEIVYTNNGGTATTDFLIYVVTDEFGCSYEANVNISINDSESCYRFTSFKYLSNVLEGEQEIIEFEYVDCNDDVQILEFVIPVLSNGNPFLAKQYVFNDDIGDPVICCKSGTVTQIGGNVVLQEQYNTYSESIFCSI